jgi:hypothetical protein
LRRRIKEREVGFWNFGIGRLGNFPILNPLTKKAIEKRSIAF